MVPILLAVTICNSYSPTTFYLLCLYEFVSVCLIKIDDKEAGNVSLKHHYVFWPCPC